jgi:hypothetical protein
VSNDLAPKDPDVPAVYEIDWQDELVIEADRSRTFSTGDVVRAQRDTGWYYECTTAGRTSAHYPQWPREAEVTVTDGSVTWTARHPDDASVPSVSSADWTVPAGLTLDSQQEQGMVTYITLSGGTDGVDYDVLCSMTPSSGNVIEQTIVVKVRAQ